ncbi:MAG: iron-containing alcohol dehydrogenase family protein [Solibacillus sp.]
MLILNTPKQYVREENILAKTAEYVKGANGKVLIVSGKTAFEQVKAPVITSLVTHAVDYEIFYFTGYATHHTIQQIIEKGQQIGATSLIGIGGGSALDSAKAAAEHLGAPIITIPTIAATCAAWTALSVIYSENGETIDFIRLNNSPEAILVDPNILVQAPVRYLQAGIADTLVKWYEFAPYINEEHYEFAFTTSLHNAKLAIQILETYSLQATKDNENQQVTRAFLQVIDTVLALAGLVGSIQGDSYKEPLAHALHNKLTYFPETHHTLHGEKVIFGLIVQFFLEKKEEKEIEAFIHYLAELKQPVTLTQLGFTENSEDTIQQLAQLLTHEQKTATFPHPLTAELVETAIYKADALGQQILYAKEQTI